MMNTMDRIKELTEANIKAQIETQTKLAEEAARRDEEKISKALEMIEKCLVYKDLSQPGWGHKYVLATADMFLQDYTNEPDDYYHGYYQRGVVFTDEKEGSDKYVYGGVFKVNGNRYYDIRYILNKYIEDVRKTAAKLEYEGQKIHDIQVEYEEAVKEWPKLKNMLLEWNQMIEERQNMSEE